jgi:hypothetical protein
MEVTHLGCPTVHQLIAGFLLMHSEVDPVQNIAYGQGPLENPKSENHQAKTTPQNPHPIIGTRKANSIQAIEQEQHA